MKERNEITFPNNSDYELVTHIVIGNKNVLHVGGRYYPGEDADNPFCYFIFRPLTGAVIGNDLTGIETDLTRVGAEIVFKTKEALDVVIQQLIDLRDNDENGNMENDNGKS